jgi:hypothetical protein
MAELNGANNGLPMSVDRENNGRHRGNVSARSASRGFYISRDDKLSFNWTSAFDGTTGGIYFSIQNKSSIYNLYIEDIHLSSLTNCSWDFYFTQKGDVPAGTTLGVLNLNREGPDDADFAAFGNAAVTGITNTTTSRFIRFQTKDHDDVESNFGGALILGRNDGMNIEIAGATLGGASGLFITVHGHYE